MTVEHFHRQNFLLRMPYAGIKDTGKSLLAIESEMQFQSRILSQLGGVLCHADPGFWTEPASRSWEGANAITSSAYPTTKIAIIALASCLTAKVPLISCQDGHKELSV